LLALGAGLAFADPNPAPANLTVWVLGAEVRLAWLAPEAASGNRQIRLLRRLNTPPAGPEDPAADLLYAGSATQYVDPLTGLLPNFASPQVYYYSAYGCDLAGTICESVGSHAALAPTLVECLRGGGYTIHWRHADADVCGDHLELGTAANTSVPNWWRSCDANCTTGTARQLNATGVQRATIIGQQMRSMGIPIGRVVSSEYCRCIQTAENMAFGPTIETSQGLTYFVYDEANRCATNYDLIEEAPAAGTNTAIIGHAGFATSCATIGSLAWSECAIFKPDGQGGATLIGRLLWNQWGTLATDVPGFETMAATTWLDTPYEAADGVRLRYRLANAVSQPIRLEVFDIRGRRIWSVQEHQARGEYERMWDRRDTSGREVPRGVYFVRLHTPASTTSRKAVILHR
jgi:phosphohistidine phosphatase SixA